jgi:hypothetical protein
LFILELPNFHSLFIANYCQAKTYALGKMGALFLRRGSLQIPSEVATC